MRPNEGGEGNESRGLRAQAFQGRVQKCKDFRHNLGLWLSNWRIVQ